VQSQQSITIQTGLLLFINKISKQLRIWNLCCKSWCSVQKWWKKSNKNHVYDSRKVEI